MRTVSETIAEWVKATDYGDIPQGVVDVARRSILDFIGVTLAGSREPAARIVEQYLAEVKGAQQSTVIGLGIKTTCAEAAWANGFLGHYLDFDDTLMATAGVGGHITGVVLPAALAAAERGHNTGKEVIAAYILGCEVAARLSRGVGAIHFDLGWHSTATLGIFGAVAAASKLLGLTSSETAYALGIAGSEASGLRENFGTMTKPFHSGQAAAKGVKASLLAKLGFDSARTIFEGKYGFCNVLSKDAKIAEITAGMGQPFCLSHTKRKLYPCCGASHAAIYAALELVQLHDIHGEDIEAVAVKCEPMAVEVLKYDRPGTALEGRFSMQFHLALAISEREVTLPQFTDEKVKSAEITALMERIRLVPDREFLSNSPTARPQMVEISLRDGRKLAKRCDFPPGSPESPLSDKDILGKYRSCARLALPEAQVEKSIGLLMNLERINDIGELLNLLGG